MPVIDAHSHIYPDKIAWQGLLGGGRFLRRGHERQERFRRLDACGLRGLAHHPSSGAFRGHNAGPGAHHQRLHAEQCREHENFIGFATMHQDFEDMEGEIDRAIQLGLKGVKIHPDTQKVNMDDPRLMRLYEIIEGRLPIVIHTGDYRYDYSHPRRLKRILHTFPKLVVDAAHFGGWSVFDYALEYLEDENCYVDTSSALEFLGPRRTVELARAYGIERVMFGSDFPMWSPVNEYNMLAAMPFTEDEFEAITWHNAQRFIGQKIK